jgi:hypothetical protein
MKSTFTLFLGIGLVFPWCLPAAVYPAEDPAAAPVENVAASSVEDLSSTETDLDCSSGLRYESASPEYGTAAVGSTEGRERAEFPAPERSSLMNAGSVRAEQAGSEDLRWWWLGGAIAVGGAGLILGVYVWWRGLRKRRLRENQVLRLLMLPTAYTIPPEPPVPNAVPTSEKIRSAA